MQVASEKQKEVVEAMKAYSILQMKVSGFDYETIAARLGIDATAVRKVVKAAADQARRESRELVNEQFMIHLRRTEKLYLECQARLDSYNVGGVLGSGLTWKDVLETIKVMLQLLVRQSDLLGLDNDRTKAARSGKSGVNDWLSDPNVSPLKVAEEATRAGIRVPESFVEEGMKWSIAVPPLTPPALS